MHNYWQTVIGRQFAAAIQMLRSAVEACPGDLWDDRAGGTPCWRLAYHALFYADFCLSDDAETFRARDYHEDKANEQLAAHAAPRRSIDRASAPPRRYWHRLVGNEGQSTASADVVIGAA
jgi:hypothetical protein